MFNQTYDAMEKNVTLYVDTNSMVEFFKDDTAYGSADKPYVADSFYTVDAPDVFYKGHSVMILQPSCRYNFALNASLQKQNLVPLTSKMQSSEAGEMIVSMISEKVPTKEEWGQIVNLDKTPHTISFDGKLLIPQNKSGVFTLVTQEKISSHKNLKYSFYFQIEGTSKIGFIDPYISNRTDGNV